MKIDYSPAEQAPRRSARRSVWLATACMAVLSVVATREGIATRHSALQDAAGDEVAAAFTPSTENAFDRSEEHTSELQSLMRNSYAVFCLNKKNVNITNKYQKHIIK